jgi:hypothetical protein
MIMTVKMENKIALKENNIIKIILVVKNATKGCWF